VSVLLGKGDGTFAAKLDYPTGAFPYAVALGDLNGDGRLDLVTPRSNSAEASVLLGTGDGGFAAGVVYPTGVHPSTDDPRICYPTSVALGDLDGDGRLDVVVANEGSGTVSVLLGAGDGAFAAKVDYPAGAVPVSVALGDLNGDGNLDIFAARHDADAVSVLLGKGDGTFPTWAPYATDDPSSSTALGDLNGDGKLDVVAASRDSNEVSVLLGVGDGAFAVQVPYPAGGPRRFVQEYEFVALGDLDADGKLDLVAGSYNPEAPGTVGVLLGKGDGTFWGRTDFPVADGPTRVALGDLNGDGKLDIVASSRSGYYGASGTVSVLLGKGDGAFATNVDYAAGIQPYSVALGDLDGDGQLEIIVLDFDPTGSEVLSVLPGNGDGTFATRVSYPSPSGDLRSMALGDLNADGRVDVVVVGSDVVDVLLGKADGTLASLVEYRAAGLDPGSAALGDLDGDGQLDLVTAGSYASTMSILLGTGDGKLAPKSDYAARAASVALGDLDADGNLDLVGVSGLGTVDVLLRPCP
jgi:hypothetical protein